MQKLTLIINGATFEVTLAEQYAEAFKEEIGKDLNLYEDNSVKTLLYAFLKKNYEVLELKTNSKSSRPRSTISFSDAKLRGFLPVCQSA